MTHTDEVVESILVDFETKFSYGGFGGLLPQQRDGGVNLMREVKHFIRGALATAQAAAVEECMRVVEEYGQSMSRLHEEMIGKAHEDSKMMLAYDMHSRLISVKHIKEKLLSLLSPTPAEVTSEDK